MECQKKRKSTKTIPLECYLPVHDKVQALFNCEGFSSGNLRDALNGKSYVFHKEVILENFLNILPVCRRGNHNCDCACRYDFLKVFELKEWIARFTQKQLGDNATVRKLQEKLAPFDAFPET